jgi:hypothetical protein
VKKLLKKIKKFIARVAVQTPVIDSVVYKVAEKLDNKQEKEELRQRVLNQPQAVQVSEKNLLAEGVSAMKRGMRDNMHLFGSGRNYRGIGEDGEESGFDLLSYAPGQNQKRAEIMKQTTDLTTKDVKSDAEMCDMIDQRIGHYKELHKAKTERELVRKLRHETDPSSREEIQRELNDIRARTKR